MKSIEIPVSNSLYRRIQDTWANRRNVKYYGSVENWLRQTIEYEFPPLRSYWLVGKENGEYPNHKKPRELSIRDIDLLIGYRSSTNGSRYMIKSRWYKWGGNLTRKTLFKRLVEDMDNVYSDGKDN